MPPRLARRVTMCACGAIIVVGLAVEHRCPDATCREGVAWLQQTGPGDPTTPNPDPSPVQPVPATAAGTITATSTAAT